MDSNYEELLLPCSEKLAFDTKKEALATATVAKHRYGSKLHAYKCRFCGLWHIASGGENS